MAFKWADLINSLVEAIRSMKKHLTKGTETLRGKVEKHNETSKKDLASSSPMVEEYKETCTKGLASFSRKVEEYKETSTKGLASLCRKVEEQDKKYELISDVVTEIKSQTSQIKFDLQEITQLVSGFAGKISRLESNKDKISPYWERRAVDVVQGTSTKV